MVSWVEHVFRHPESLAFQLLHVQDDEWLQTMRILVGRSGGGFNMFGGETQTRTAGIAPQRWGEGWVHLVGVSYRFGDKLGSNGQRLLDRLLIRSFDGSIA